MLRPVESSPPWRRADRCLHDLERVDEVVLDERAPHDPLGHRPDHLLEEELGIGFAADDAPQDGRHGRDEAHHVGHGLLVEQPGPPRCGEVSFVVRSQGRDESLVGKQFQHELGRGREVLDGLPALDPCGTDQPFQLQHAGGKIPALEADGRHIELAQPGVLLVFDTTHHAAETIAGPGTEQIRGRRSRIVSSPSMRSASNPHVSRDSLELQRRECVQVLAAPAPAARPRTPSSRRSGRRHRGRNEDNRSADSPTRARNRSASWRVVRRAWVYRPSPFPVEAA